MSEPTQAQIEAAALAICYANCDMPCERCEMQAKAALIAAERAAWQDIATAPKDGEQVLLQDGRWGPYVGWWGAHDDGPDNWHFLDVTVQGDHLNCWQPGYGPTHWRPLPAPPQPDRADST